MPNKISKARLRADLELDPIVEFCQNTRGASVRIASELTRRSGERIHASNVRLWLAPNLTERVDPRLGMGLLMLDLWREGVFQKQETNGD